MSIFTPGGYVHSRAPGPVDELHRMNEVADSTAGGPELDLCRLRLAQLHGTAEVSGHAAADQRIAELSTWWESESFSAHERACLAFTEQFVMSVSAVTQADIDALLRHWTEHQVYDFVMALYVLDLSSRARLTLGALLEEQPDRPARAPGA